jgi:parallel beta-helix repeat protein
MFHMPAKVVLPVAMFLLLVPSMSSCQLQSQRQKTAKVKMTVHVHPGKAPQGVGHVSGLQSIPWNDLGPGSVILLHSDQPFEENLYVRSSGLADAPIVIRSAGGRAIINGAVIFENTAHVVLENLTIQNSKYPSVHIKNKAHSITVSGCKIANSGLGVWVTGSAGMNNRIENNEIFSHETHGVAIDRVNCSSGQETVIANNEIHNNGHHGIEINGSGYIVEGNVVYENGASIPGTSGIHVFSKSESEDSGDHNVIRYNVSYNNREDRGPDGNGIQIDQWCDDNVVHHNLTYANDGAGISVFDASRSNVYNNTSYGNMRDPGKSHPYRAELVLASDYTNNVDRVTDAIVRNNILVATRPSEQAIYVDALTADNKLVIEHNLHYQTRGEPFFFWKDRKGASIEQWNSTSPGIAGDLYGDPQFAVASPKSTEGFRLKKSSPCVNRGALVPSERDLLGNRLPPGTAPDLGAIESQ